MLDQSAWQMDEVPDAAPDTRRTPAGTDDTRLGRGIESGPAANKHAVASSLPDISSRAQEKFGPILLGCIMARNGTWAKSV